MRQERVSALLSLVCGALFGAGVCVSGMVRPSKVIGFLDLGGTWDASLALVMGTALAIHAVAWRLVKRATAPRFGELFPAPAGTELDRRLLGGSVLFGVGWALSGFCPGPAVVSLVSGSPASFVFVGAMLAGIYVVDSVDRSPL